MRGWRGGWFLCAGLILGLGVGLTAWGGASGSGGLGSPAPPARLTPVSAPVVEAYAPSFEARDPEGESLVLNDLRGETVVLNFWASWCEPCRQEMPLLEAPHHQWASSGLRILGINAEDTADQIGAFREDLELTFPRVMDPEGEVEARYQVRGYPTTFLVDREDVVRFVHAGVLQADVLDEYLQEMGLH